MRYLAIIVALVCLGSNCSAIIRPEDRGRVVIENGAELHPAYLPFDVVISDSIEHPESVIEAIDDFNLWVDPIVLFTVEVNQERWRQLDDSLIDQRYGIILVSQGFTSREEWSDEFVYVDSIGISGIWRNSSGEILSSDVIISSDYAYSRSFVYRTTLHLLGHTLGLDHDDSSLDLGSCMSVPPVDGCSITRHDIEIIRQGRL